VICEEVKEGEKSLIGMIEKIVGGKVEYTSECKERKEVHLRSRLLPTKFRNPPCLKVYCEDENCNVEIIIERTSPAKVKEIRNRAREKGYFVSSCEFRPLFMCYDESRSVVIGGFARIDDLPEKVEEMVGWFRREFDR